MAKSPLPPVRDKAFDDDDINPEISAAVDGIQLERTLALSDAEKGGWSLKRIAVIAAVTVAVIMIWQVVFA